MAHQENSTRPQREAKKRAAAALCELHSGASKKKRVALGDLTNNLNNNTVAAPPPAKPVPGDKEFNQKEEKTTRAKKRTVVKKPKPATPPENVDAKLEDVVDPQLCAPYVSDIYEYLRRMEVFANFN